MAGISTFTDMIDLALELAPLLIYFLLFTMAFRIFQDFAHGRRPGQGNSFIFIIVIAILLMVSIAPTGNAETIDYQPNKKYFSYMDLCNKYVIYNQSENKLLSDLDSDEYQILLSDDLTNFGIYKPSKTILWNESFDTDTLNLITEYVFDITKNHEIEIDIYYENVSDNAPDKESISFFFSEYINDEVADNITTQYRIIQQDEIVNNDTTNDQSIYTRTSKLFNDNQDTNVYNEYHKQLLAGVTKDTINVQDLTLTIDKSIKNNEFVTIRISPQTLVNNKDILYSYNFINFGIIKNNKNDTVIIDEIKIRSIDEKKEIETSPFMEYYEFHHIPSIVNGSTLDEIDLMTVDLVENDYNDLFAHEFRVYTRQVNTGPIEQHHFRVDFDGVNILAVGDPFEEHINATGDNDIFIGYQIYIQYSVNQTTNEGFYTVYLYFKWDVNTNELGPLDIVYNWLSYTIIIKDNDYLYLANLHIYKHADTSHYEQNYKSNSRKWDVIDRSITAIDENVDILVIVQDADAGGLSLPGVGDLKKMLQSIVVTPISTVLENIFNKINLPIAELVSLITTLGQTVIALQGLGNAIVATTASIGIDLGDILLDFNAFLIEFGLLKTAILNDLPDILTGVGSLKDDVSQLVLTDLPAFFLDFGNLVIAIDLLIGDFNTFIDDFADLVIALQEVPTFISLIVDNLTDIIIAIDTVAIDLVAFIIWIGSLFANIILNFDDYIVLLFSFYADMSEIILVTFDIVFSIIGLVLLYNLIFAILRFNESGDFADLWAIMEVYMRIAEVLFQIIRSIFNFLGGVIP